MIRTENDQESQKLVRDRDTIAAIATAPGKGGVGILRVSGAAAEHIAMNVLSGACPQPRRAVYRSFLGPDNQVIDQGLALWFPGPNSFTGEDVLELQGHGSPIALNLLLKRLLQLGARLARPGEFTERAFLNGKVDLVQAEAVADLIESATETAAVAAQRTLSGDFSRRVKALELSLMNLRIFIEASMDFPDEEVDFLSEGQVGRRVDELVAQFEQLIQSTHSGVLLRDGIKLVLAGKPNVGKSSLLNRLSGRESAIVTPQPGTTRDCIRETLELSGLAVEVVDTAGLRQTRDEIEREGVARARNAVAEADLVLLITDRLPRASEDLWNLKIELLNECPVPNDRFVFIVNKVDILGRKSGNFRFEAHEQPEVCLGISALRNEGIDCLVQEIHRRVGYSSVPSLFTARERHLNALERAGDDLKRGKLALERGVGGELIAEDLKRAHQSLGEILGEVSSDELLGEIFSKFCIGK